MEPKTVRLIDIANILGVSKVAVGAALNPERKSTVGVSDALREKVQNLAREMNYVPNPLARTLAGHSAKLIGLLIDTGAPPVVRRLLAEIEHQAADLGYGSLTGETHDNVENMMAIHQTLARHWVDGIVCMSHGIVRETDKLSRYFAGKDDVVFVAEPIMPGHRQVLLNIESGIAEAVRLLLAQGCRDVALVVPPGEEDSIRRRIDGFLSVLPEKANRVFSVPFGVDNPEGLRASMREHVRRGFLPRSVDGLVVSNDISALALISELTAHGIRIPDDVAVVGFDNEPFSSCLALPLATIDQNIPEQARVALELLMDVILNKPESRPPPRTVYIKPKLIVRESAMKGRH